MRTLRRLKLPMPEYDGAADLETYEAFVHKFDSWCRAKELQGRYAVELLNYALTGKAATWYLRHVALDTRTWTMQQVYDELWKYCFPVSFREDMRKKLMHAKQRGCSVKDFAQDIQNVAARYPDIDRYTVKRIFWDGVDSYIRLFWIDKGRSVEDSLRALIHYAKRAELRELERRRSQEAERGSTTEDSAASNSEMSEHSRVLVMAAEPYKEPDERESNSGETSGAECEESVGDGTASKAEDADYSEPSVLTAHDVVAPGGRLTHEELREHFALGLCFRCHEAGHMARDCAEGAYTESGSNANTGKVSERQGTVDERSQDTSDTSSESACVPAKPRVKRKYRPVPAGLVRVMGTTSSGEHHRSQEDCPLLAQGAEGVCEERD